MHAKEFARIKQKKKTSAPIISGTCASHSGTNKLGGSCSSELRKKFSFLPGRSKPEMGCSCSDSNEGHKHEHDLNDGDILRSPEQEEALRQKVSQVIASAAGC